MKFAWETLTILLAVALVLLCIQNAKLSKGQSSKEESVEAIDKEQIILESIMTRTSVRKYTSKLIEKDKVETLLRAGMTAPTAGNRQPWELVVVDDKEILRQIPPIIKGAHMADKAPLAIVVCGSPSRALVPDYWIQDCSAVTQNILLAAHAMEMGAVWCGSYPDNNTGKVKKMQELLSLPDDILPLSVIVIGYTDAEQVVKDKWDTAKVHYNKY